MKYFTKKIIAVLLTVMLTGITVLHVSGGQTIKVNAAQTFNPGEAAPPDAHPLLLKIP